MKHIFDCQNLESYLSAQQFQSLTDKLNDEDDKRIFSKIYNKSTKPQTETEPSKFICCTLFSKKDKDEEVEYSLRSKYEIKNLIGVELLRQISKAVLVLYDEEKFSLKQKDYYLNSGLKKLN